MVETVAVVTAALFAVLALFQAALAIGAPWGEHVYGGRMAQDDGALPGRWRAASGIASLVLLGFAWVMLIRGGVIATDLDENFVTVLAWMVVAYMAINTAVNFSSQDPVERWVMGPITAILVVLCAVVAAAGPQATDVVLASGGLR
jgi:hypothetical protein